MTRRRLATKSRTTLLLRRGYQTSTTSHKTTKTIVMMALEMTTILWMLMGRPAATFWDSEEKEAWTKVTNRPKAMTTSLEFHQAWQSRHQDERIQQTLRMMRTRMTLTTTSWLSLNFSKVTRSRTTFSVILPIMLCGLSMEDATLAEWALTLQLCTRLDRVHRDAQATLTQKKKTPRRTAFSSNGVGLAGIARLSQDTSLRSLSPLKKVATWSEAMAHSTTTCTTTVLLSKLGKICLKRRPSSLLSIWEVESTPSVAMMLTTKFS